MKKVMIFSALIMAPIVIAVVVYVIGIIADGERWAAFSRIQDNKPPLTQADVEKLLGPPAHIEQSQAADETITGEVYHYPHHNDDMKIVFVNGTVFSAKLVPGAKS